MKSNNMDNKFLNVISNEDAKKEMFDILSDVAEFCDSYGIRYFLSFGTLIGAVRHHGYIPWDDDIDIEMPRKDYNRFIKLYRQNGKYKLSTSKDKESYILYSKVYSPRTIRFEDIVDYQRYNPIGVDIDIFPLDGLPANNINYKLQTDLRFLFVRLHNATIVKTAKKKLLTRIFIFLCRLIGRNFFEKLFRISASLYDFDKSEYVGFCTVFDIEKYKTRHKKDVYSGRVKVQFEGKSFWAPSGYDEYLRDIYGDYMTPPPMEKQTSHHGFTQFWAE